MSRQSSLPIWNKSVANFVQGVEGISCCINGSLPWCCWLDWHMSHDLNSWSISVLILGQQTDSLERRRVFSISRCPVCSWLSIPGWRGFGIMTYLPLNITPSEIPSCSLCDQYCRRSCVSSLMVSDHPSLMTCTSALRVGSRSVSLRSASCMFVPKLIPLEKIDPAHWDIALQHGDLWEHGQLGWASSWKWRVASILKLLILSNWSGYVVVRSLIDLMIDVSSDVLQWCSDDAVAAWIVTNVRLSHVGNTTMEHQQHEKFA